MICHLPAIDVHGHFGQYVQPETHPLKCRFMSGDPSAVLARAKAACVEYTVVSSLRAFLPRGQADVVAGNEETHRVVQRTAGLLQWVVLHPGHSATIDQVREMLGKPKCVGIKIHPEEHCYPIAQHGRTIFELAAEYRAVVLTHSGEPNSLPADFVPFANDFPEVTLILAHLGNSGRRACLPSCRCGPFKTPGTATCMPTARCPKPLAGASNTYVVVRRPPAG